MVSYSASTLTSTPRARSALGSTSRASRARATRARADRQLGERLHQRLRDEALRDDVRGDAVLGQRARGARADRRHVRARQRARVEAPRGDAFEQAARRRWGS